MLDKIKDKIRGHSGPTELEMHRMAHRACKNAGYENPEEALAHITKLENEVSRLRRRLEHLGVCHSCGSVFSENPGFLGECQLCHTPAEYVFEGVGLMQDLKMAGQDKVVQMAEDKRRNVGPVEKLIRYIKRGLS